MSQPRAHFASPRQQYRERAGQSSTPPPNSPASESLTAAQFVERIMPVVRAEAGFTALEGQDTTLGGYVADLQQACARILDGQIEVGGVRLHAPTATDAAPTGEEEA